MFPPINRGTLERYRVSTTGERLQLSEIDPRDRKGLPVSIVRVTLDALDLTYPSEMPDLDRLQIK